MKRNIQHVARALLLTLLCGVFCMLQVQAQTHEVFNDLEDVVLAEIGGDTVAFVSSFGTDVTEISASSGSNTGSTLYLGDVLDGDLDGTAFERLYVFIDPQFTTNTHDFDAANTAMVFGDYDAARSVSGFTASSQEYLSQIDLTWSEVSGADGYLIFREDQEGPWPLAVMEGQQLTSYSDAGLDVFQFYTYYIIPYTLTGPDYYLGSMSMVTGQTRGFAFTATATSEATVAFTYDFDNHLLIGLDQQSAYVEVTDLTLGEVVYGDDLTLTDIAENALLFDYAVDFSGDDTGGVYGEANLGSLDTWTAEMWVYLDEANRGAYPYLLEDGNMRVRIDGSERLAIQGWGDNLRSESLSNDWGSWVFLAVSYDGNEIRAYKNGAPFQMFNNSTNGPLQDANEAAGAGLSSPLTIGQPASGGGTWSDNFHGAMGMVRFWDRARTPDQVAQDYEDIYDAAVPGLLAQWTFSEESVALPDDIHGNILTLGTTNNTYPVRWSPAYEFVDADLQKSMEIWLEAPATDGMIRNYELTVYESGSGRVLSSGQDDATFTHPGAPSVVVAEHSETPYRLDVTVTPVSEKADRYQVYRETGDESLLLGTYNLTANEAGTYDPFVVSDEYAYGSSTSLVGGDEVTYVATPVYTAMERTQVDVDNQGQSASVATLDFLTSVAPNAEQSGITFTWDETVLTQSGYDTLRLERDGQLLAYVPTDAGSFTDTLMLFGVPYAYTAVVVENGTESWAQSDSAQLDPNGAIFGTVISATGDFVLPQQSLILTNADDGAVLSQTTTDAYGQLQISGLYYGLSQSFAFQSSSQATVDHEELWLTRQDWEVALGYITYDTTLEETAATGMVDSLEVSNTTAENALYLSWDATTPAGGETVFTNVYRDDTLIAIVADQTSYTDWYATLGTTHTYRLQGYFYAADGSTLYVQSTEDQQGDLPSLSPINDFLVQATTDGITEVSWSYATEALVSTFEITRTNVSTRETYTVAEVGHQTGDAAYHLLDSLGYPGASYTYGITAHTLPGEASELATDAVAYPTVAIAELLNIDASYSVPSAFGTDLRIFLEDGVRTLPNWDGLVMITENEESIPLEKFGAYYDEETQSVGYDLLLWNYPTTPAAAGSVELAAYKHTDEGLFISDRTTVVYSGASVPDPSTAVPTEPMLATNDATLQLPVLTVSKDARGKVMVQWTYPEYTEVTFRLSYREMGATDWTTETLPNEQRAWLHEDPAAATMEYLLLADYGNGELSGEVWDYGVARKYQQVQGYVRDAERLPQSNVWVGLEDHWTLTDSAGFYRLEDLELPNGNYDIAYFVPGLDGYLPIDITLTDEQQVYNVDIESEFTNRIMQASDEVAEVFAVTGYADPVNLTNEVRWNMNNTMYTGVKVYENTGENEVADLRNGATLLFTDSLTSNNAGSGLYWVRPYLTNAMGELEFNDEGSLTLEDLDYPVLTAPTYADAFSNEEDGTVVLTWAHERNNVDGYLIYRNDYLLGDVSADSSSTFTDEVGLPQQVYRYSIYSYVMRGNEVVTSLNPITLDAVYPSPGNLTAATVNSVLVEGTALDENALAISWTYPTQANLDGVVIYRGLDSIGTVAYPATEFIDYEGLPETYSVYTLRSYDERDGTNYYASGIEATGVFPQLQVPTLVVTHPQFDSVTFDWTYPQHGVEFFDLYVINDTQADTVLSTQVSHVSDAYTDLFSEGISGHDYTVAVRAGAERNGATYYSEEATASLTHLVLPTPVMGIAYTTGDQDATLTWTMETERMEGWNLIVTLDGNEKVNIDLPANQREYVYTADFSELQSLGINGGTVEFILTAHQDEQGGTATMETATATMALPDATYYVGNFEASDGYANSVLLSWNTPSNAAGLTGYTLKRDGETLTTLGVSEVSYADENAYPGVSHIYKMEAVHGSDTYAATTRGGILGDGLITAQIFTELGLPLEGDSLIITATVNGIPYADTAYADADGKVYLRNLAYDDEGITYIIAPAGNLADYDIASREHNLSLSATQGSAGVFYNILSRDLVGTIANVNCTNGCGRDSVEVILYGKLISGETETLDEEKTDFDGQFVFELPYYMDEYESFILEVNNQATDGTGEAMLPFGYYLGTEAAHEVDDTDSTLTVTLPVADLNQVDEYPLAIFTFRACPMLSVIASG
ncbi:MAG: LamG domain-containing protein, partial [Bacteroidota bacterium]